MIRERQQQGVNICWQAKQVGKPNTAGVYFSV